MSDWINGPLLDVPKLLKRIAALEERVTALEAVKLAESHTLHLKKRMTKEDAKQEYEKTFGRG